MPIHPSDHNSNFFHACSEDLLWFACRQLPCTESSPSHFHDPLPAQVVCLCLQSSSKPGAVESVQTMKRKYYDNSLHPPLAPSTLPFLFAHGSACPRSCIRSHLDRC